MGKKNTLLNRFKIVVDNKKINIPICILLLLVMSFYVFCSGRYVVQNAGEPPEDDMSWTYSDFTSENSYIKLENNTYVLYYNGEKFLENNSLKNLPDVPFIED